jgi:hypothetical protein
MLEGDPDSDGDPIELSLAEVAMVKASLHSKSTLPMPLMDSQSIQELTRGDSSFRRNQMNALEHPSMHCANSRRNGDESIDMAKGSITDKELIPQNTACSGDYYARKTYESSILQHKYDQQKEASINQDSSG